MVTSTVAIVQHRIYDAALKLFAEKGTARLTVRELADAAGVARGTIYNHCCSMTQLFEQVTAQLAQEMQERIVAALGTTGDPAQQLAHGIRIFVRRAHDEPHWGRFITRFAVNEPTLQTLWHGPLMLNLQQGVSAGRYELTDEQIMSASALCGSAVLAAILLVLEGHRTYRAAGSEFAEMTLRSLGLPCEHAHALAHTALPELPPLPATDSSA